MNQQQTRNYGPLLFTGLLLPLYFFFERIVPSVKEAGFIGHYGLPFIWSVILTVLLWVSLERAHVIPESMSLRRWSRQPWNPARTYALLLAVVVGFGGLTLVMYFRGSREFFIPLIITANAVVALLFYWLYRMGYLFLVAGILSLLLGFVQIVSFLMVGLREPEPVVINTFIAIFMALYALFFCYTGIVLIRKWRHPGSWQGSWRSFGWGYLVVFSFTFALISIPAKGAVAASFMMGSYLFIYAVGKFVSSVGTRHSAERIDGYTRTISLKHFLLFALADRWQWEEFHHQTSERRITLISLTRSLFDVFAFAAVAAALALFRDASIAQQISFALLVIVFHIAANLSDYTAAARDLVARERARLEQELQVAHDMQMGLMPASDPTVPGFDITGACLPASEVGGDFYDYVWLDKAHTKLGIALADVSGKAMKAAMTAVMTSGMVYREVEGGASPKEVLTRINKPMYLKLDRRVFTAMSFAVIDTVKRKLSFSNAGQMHPLLLRKGLIRSLKVGGVHLPLGVKEHVPYREVSQKFVAGDVVVFYTDGLPESMNEVNELFGFERIESTLLKLQSSETAHAVVEGLVADARAFAGPAKQHDDMTVVAAKVY